MTDPGRTPVVDQIKAIEILVRGSTVEYQPEGGTPYVLALVKLNDGITGYPAALLCLDQYWIPPLEERVTAPHHFAANPGTKVGDWPAIRPILAALGRAKGKPEYTPFDAIVEGETGRAGTMASR